MNKKTKKEKYRKTIKMNCPVCNNTIKQEDKTCPKCGVELTWEQQKYNKFSKVSLILGPLALAATFIGCFLALGYAWEYGMQSLNPHPIRYLYTALMICVPGFSLGTSAVVFGTISLRGTVNRGASIAGIIMGAFVVMIFSPCVFAWFMGHAG